MNSFHGHAQRPKNIEEWFNFRHSLLRNVIERCFGVLKARFPILKQMPPYSIRTPKYIPTACCTVHNWIRMHDNNDDLFREYCQENLVIRQCQRASGSNSQNPIQIDISRGQLRHMFNVRDHIAEQIWASMNRT